MTGTHLTLLILEGVPNSVRIPAQAEAQLPDMRRISHPPIPNSLKVIHDFIELLDVIFGKGYVQGSDIFAETGGTASAGRPQGL